MAQSVKGFIFDAYRLVTASSPTVPLHGSDEQDALNYLNDLFLSYSASGLLVTISQKVTFTVAIGQQFVTFGAPTVVPTPNVTVGRLANMENAWLNLDGVDYPLIDESRNVFFASYKYFPQQGLPRFVIITNDTAITTMQLYPAPSQVYTLWVYGKFEPAPLTLNGDMSGWPLYYQRFFKMALGKEIAAYKGRQQAWTDFLEQRYLDAKKDMESVSSMNLTIDTDNESYLNGKWRVMAGV